MLSRIIAVTAFFFTLTGVHAQNKPFIHADTLRGSIGPGRDWWDVVFYDLTVTPDIKAKTIEGQNTIVFKTVKEGRQMQVDLQQPLEITKVVYKKQNLRFKRDGNAFFIDLPKVVAAGKTESITIHYKGKPVEAKQAPWDGGLVWKKDKKGRPFINTACQGAGASIWWPTKDHQSDEPDSMRFTTIVPDTLVSVGNGRLRSVTPLPKKLKAYSWFIKNPINNYNIALNIGKYVHIADSMRGENGLLTLDYYVLDYNREKALTQFAQVKSMMTCFENWFGPYPFYEDGYKLVESDHLGMEHQSAVAYGNKYQNGYLGRDLSGSGWGLKWDFIIVHESGHEWFGNNITTKDIADMWVHESFTNYSETIYTECQYGKEAGNQYNFGIRKNIDNDRAIIGPYGVNTEGSGDMYYKGGNMIHTIRQAMNNDALFKQVLRGLNRQFRHQTVTTQQIEEFISKESGIDFNGVFDQYLRDTRIPNLMYMNKIENGRIIYQLKWGNCVPHFALPVKMETSKGNSVMVYPNTKGYITVKTDYPESFSKLDDVFDKNVYITVSKVDIEN
jgi:aminopeptidase N